MKKLSLILILFISLALTLPISKAFALGNGTGNLGATPAQLAAITAAAGAPTAPAPTAPTVSNLTNSNAAFNVFNKIQNGLLKTGPTLASSITNISGTLFSYLAVIALILWAIQNLLFGDKGIKEFMLFAFFIVFARGLLAAYNLFFVNGVVYFFYSIGQQVAGVTDPMTLVQNIFYDFYSTITAQLQQQGSFSIWAFGTGITIVICYFAGIIILLASFFLIAGTILVVQLYIVTALVAGYIFVPFMIFKPLEFLWNGWLKFLLVSAISYFLIFIILKIFNLFMLNTLLTYVKSLNSTKNYNIESIINEVTYTFILLVFGWFVTKIPAIAGEIVSGMPNMSVTAVIAPIITQVKNISTGGVKMGGAAKTSVIERAKGGRSK
ncbi:MAG: type IV secretion system protein [bacterium]